MKVKKCLDCSETIFKKDTHATYVAVLYQKGKIKERSTHSLCDKCRAHRQWGPAPKSGRKR